MIAATGHTAFDDLAADYDAAFSNRLPARWLRSRVRDRIGRWLPAGATIIDVGCGTGDDAIWLARRGHAVMAADVSECMLEQTRRKLAALAESERARVSVVRLDAAAPEFPDSVGMVDVVWSNFGAVNCLPDAAAFLQNAARHLRPGGIAALVVMGPFCLWESAGFALRGDVRRARRRWRGRGDYVTRTGSQPVWYHSPGRLAAAAARQFDVMDLCGIGVFLPSTEFFAVCEARPRLFRLCAWLETRLAALWPFARIGDHYLLVLRRKADASTT